MQNLLAITLGIGMVVGGVMTGCGGDSATPTSGAGASSAGGNGAGGNPAGSSSSGNPGGAGGAGGCSSAADCSDGFTCTIDSCNAGQCEHAVGPNSGTTVCPTGKMCQLGFGCVDIVICADSAQCVDKLGSDPCKTNISCDLAASVCTYSPLDKDNDGYSPIVCGGKDCDDSTSQVQPGAAEKCDGKDNNCNGTPDENATCPGLATCNAGTCQCAPEDACGIDCVDKMTSNTHCGMCNNACLGIASCIGGQCNCPAGATTCDTVCVDTKTDTMNCGGCGKSCPPGYSCANGFCTCLGTPCGTVCRDTMNDPLNCGGCGIACGAGLGCQNGTCACGAGQTTCNGQCTDTNTSSSHCGGCNKPCNGLCQNGTCTSCTAANLYLFGDLSGSMDTEIVMGGQKKIDVMRTGINTFVADTLSANMGVGVGYHPVNGTMGVCSGTTTPCTMDSQCSFPFVLCDLASSCTNTDYETPGVGIALLPGNQTAINNSLAAKTAVGGSVPPPGYRGALQYTKNYALSHPGQKAAVVLILDSLPNLCNATAAADLTPIAQQFTAGTPSIRTFVIGVGADITTTAVNEIAAAGGTGTGWVIKSTTEMVAALNAIRTQYKTCP